MPAKSLKSFLKSAMRFLMRRDRKIARKIEGAVDNSYYINAVEYPYRSYEALSCLLRNYEFSTVLDVGCGEGIHSDIFLKDGKKVTAIDYGKSPYFSRMKSEPGFSCIVDDFAAHDFGDEKFDCVWCSHVLEHQLNVQDFLTKLVGLVNTTYPGGGGISCKRPCV